MRYDYEKAQAWTLALSWGYRGFLSALFN